MKLKNHFYQNFSTSDSIYNSFYILLTELMMHRQADYLFCYTVGNRKILLRR